MQDRISGGMPEKRSTYNSVQLAQKLETERSVKLSPDRLRRVLKKGDHIEALGVETTINPILS